MANGQIAGLTVTGATTGATAGSLLGPIGAIAGGVVGGAAGFVVSDWNGIFGKKKQSSVTPVAVAVPWYENSEDLGIVVVAAIVVILVAKKLRKK